MLLIDALKRKGAICAVLWLATTTTSRLEEQTKRPQDSVHFLSWRVRVEQLSRLTDSLRAYRGIHIYYRRAQETLPMISCTGDTNAYTRIETLRDTMCSLWLHLPESLAERCSSKKLTVGMTAWNKHTVGRPEQGLESTAECYVTYVSRCSRSEKHLAILQVAIRDRWSALTRPHWSV